MKNNYEKYPSWIIVTTNLFSLVVYVIGFYIILKLGLIYSILYLFFCLVLEFKLIYGHCTQCYYWGKFCGFGKGKISSLLFKKGDISKFCFKEMTWKDMILDFLVVLIPFFIGFILLIINFDWLLLIILILLILLTIFGNSSIRGLIVCKQCKQRELGCPADKLFSKKN